MKNLTVPTICNSTNGYCGHSIKSTLDVMRQLTVIILGIVLIEASIAQPQITGKVAVKRFTSFQQIQSDNYKGTGSYQKSMYDNYTIYLLQASQVDERNIESRFLELVRTMPELASDCVEKIVQIEGGRVQKLCTDANGEFKSRAFSVDQTIFVIYSIDPFSYRKIISKNGGNNLGTRTLKN
jgi:hypothetical protein